MTSMYVLVWCLISLIDRTNGKTCEDSVQSFVKNGRFIDGETIWESFTNDIVECAQSCLRLKKCRAFNFNQADGICQLRSTVGKEVLLKGNTVHSDIASWPSQIDPECYDRSCGEDEVCIPGKLARGSFCSYMCLKFGHKCPPPEGTMSSQPRTVGSVYTHTCGRGTVGGDSALCLPTGQWNKTIDTTCTHIFGMPCEADQDCAPINGRCHNNACRCETGSGYDKRSSTCVTVCGENWVHFKKKCYYFGKRLMNAFEARDVCGKKGAQLVQVDSVEENDFLKSVMRDGLQEDVWNDLYEHSTDEEERWMTSNDSLTFKDWEPGEPQNDEPILLAQRCTVFDYLSAYKWKDTMCGRKAMALCQRNITQFE